MTAPPPQFQPPPSQTRDQTRLRAISCQTTPAADHQWQTRAAEELLQHLILPPEQKPKYSGPRPLSHLHRAAMQVENSPGSVPLPPSSSSRTSSSDPNLGVLDTVFSLNDFLSVHPAPEPAPKRGNQGAGLVPIAVGARSSKHTILLHEKYQHYGIERPDFIFSGSSDAGWGVKTVFLGEALEERGPFNSKQEAKEALSEKALGVVMRLEAEGQLRRPEKGKKKRVVGGVDEGVKGEQKEKEPFVNYTGLLLEFQRSTSSPQPTYTDYALGTRFSCVLTIDNHPPFGSQEELFSSKKAARQNAAKCAVEHFRAHGLWPETSTDMGGIKKQKKPSTQPLAASLKNSSSSGAAASSVDDAAASLVAAAGGVAGSSSFASQVAALATVLNLGTPEWRYTEEPVQGFHTVACYFQNAGAHAGPIGEVRHVYGKKHAKEECARLVLRYLEELKEERLRKMADAVGRDGDGEGTEDEFEDAPEEFGSGI